MKIAFRRCKESGACAHRASRVRVNVAVGELHVAAADGEAAALPEEWRSHRKVQGKCFHRGNGRNSQETAGARVW